MKTCIACKHFYIEPGTWYSAQTGGDPASANCEKRHFYDASAESGTMIEIALSKAQECQDYELSDLARSKGWTE